jgi:hypothetical protein
MQQIPYPMSHIDDLASDLQDRRYAAAIAQVQLGDVLAVLDDLIASEPDPTKHPAATIVAYYLHAKGTDTGRRPCTMNVAAEKLDLLVKQAIDTVVEAMLDDDSAWED